MNIFTRYFLMTCDRLWKIIRENRSVFATLLLAVLVQPVPAKDAVLPIKEISIAMHAYINSIGCDGRFDPSNIAEAAGRFNLSSGGYIAVYYVDVGCAGGSRSETSAFAFLTRGAHGDIYVDPELSRPEATVGFPQSITRLREKNGDVWYEAKEFDFSKDALCCPSIDVSGKLSAISRDIKIGDKISTAWYWIDENRK